MKFRPAGVTDTAVQMALAHGWGLGADVPRYAPVGAGGYHWTAGRFFVTVDDLDAKPWLGADRDQVMTGLRAAMDTARSLASLPFVLAPIPARDGAAAARLSDRYAVTVFPYLDGVAGQWGDQRDEREQGEVLDLLAVLHRAEPVPAAPAAVALPGRAAIAALLDRPAADDGPYLAEFRALRAQAGPRIRELLAAFDRLVPVLAGLPDVITHGEPHPGNFIRTSAGLVLIDWDTVGLAPPERDLWLLPGGHARYQAATGYRPDPAALELYRIRWQLDDICAYLGDLHRASERNPAADQAVQAVQALAGITGQL